MSPPIDNVRIHISACPPGAKDKIKDKRSNPKKFKKYNNKQSGIKETNVLKAPALIGPKNSCSLIPLKYNPRFEPKKICITIIKRIFGVTFIKPKACKKLESNIGPIIE